LKLNLEEHNQILRDPNHRFFKKPKSLALAVFAVYPCHKCNKPFIGGRVSCEIGDEQLAVAEDPNKESKFVCPDCSNVQSCTKHGT
jgi:DNA-directed RNA polymerase subunit RPC12/RpoP